jgi:8-oxo-dGTP pyrophosphatase MutT (NUDIX family)
MSDEPDFVDDPAVLRDQPVERTVLSSTVRFEGAIWSVVTDRVDLGTDGDSVVSRDWVKHTGAVAVIALDDDDRVLLVEQYRHPVRALCWEAPAGLRDVPGEPLLTTAKRELLEETGHAAGRWFELVRIHNTPGGSDEDLTILLARDLALAPDAALHLREAEEQDMRVAWAPFDVVVANVLAGHLTNPSLVTGILAAAVHRAPADGSPPWSRLIALA